MKFKQIGIIKHIKYTHILNKAKLREYKYAYNDFF